MTPSARLQAAIELVDAIAEAARSGGAAADTLIARYFKTRRYAGSGDRRAVRELVYRAIRRFGEPPRSGRAAMLGLAEEEPGLRALFDGAAHGPEPIREGEEAARSDPVPAWLAERMDPAIGLEELRALLERAPLDLRVNSLKAAAAEAPALFPEAEPIPGLAMALRLPPGGAIEGSDAWRSGLIEVQDAGSQHVCRACGADPGMLVVDLCAGAGGKTLALAAAMNDSGRILACDTDRGRLARMPARIARAGVSIVEPRLIDPGREPEALADLAGKADLVLVDAPCSGSGTWRRNPETRWRITPDRLDRLTALQARLLGIGTALLRPGGRLVYAVCSLLEAEGRGQAAAFSAGSSCVPEALAIAAGRAAGAGMLLTPSHDRTDGFFVAGWRRPC